MKMKASFSTPLFAIVLYALVFASDFIKNKLTESGGNEYLSVIILQILIFIIPAIIFCRLKGVGYSAKLNIRLISPSKLGSVIASSLTLILGSIVIRFVQIYAFNMSDFSHSVFSSYIGENTAYDFLFSATAFAVMPALTEEFVFRAIMLTEYNEGGYGALNATVITSLLSAMLFFSLQSFPIRLLCAVVFCLVTYATGSALSAFLSHLIFNIYTVFGEEYIIKAMTDPSNKIISIFTFTLLLLIVTAFMFSEFEHTLRQTGRIGTPSPSYLLKKTDDGKTPDVAATEKDEDKKSGKVLSDRSKLAIEVFFSPTFLACILIFAIAIFGFI